MMTFIPGGLKELSDRRMKLALQKEIPDILAYADEWNKLGTDFEAAGAPANAAICFSNCKRYGGQLGAYRREVEGSLACLKPVDKKILVQVDDETSIRFPDIDRLANWIVDIAE
jgi:hypothetical protein